MVKRRNLRPDPRRAMADLLAKQAAQTKALGTVPTGVKDLGETGDTVWTDPDSGTESSVRELPALIDETAVAIEAAKEELEETRGDLEGAKAGLEAERVAREQALAEAAAALAELDEKLEAGPSTADLDAIRTDLAAAAEVAASATTAATEANTAALAASQAALEAAGIAASKGRVIVSETEPTGADRTPSNIWIQPVPDDPDTEVQESAVTYVYLEASDEWQATTSSELAQAAQNALDAREAAQQAQQRADTAVSAATIAQAAAEAAQRTANSATLDARDAHNAAIAAGEAAEQAAIDAAGRARVVYQDTPPAGEVDLLWFDTAQGNVPKVWTGGLGATARQNLVVNPLGPGAVDIRGWALTRFDGAIVQDGGRSALELTVNATSGPYIDPTARISPPVGTIIRLFMDIKVLQPITNGLRIYTPGYNGATSINSSTGPYYSQAPEDGWVRRGVEATVTAMPAGGYIRTMFWPAAAAFPIGTKIRLRDVQLELDTSGVYFDGDSTGARWAGERNFSASIFDGPAWVELRDAGVLAAQAAAAAAAQAAQDAYDLADGKPSTDDVQALITTSANGKNAITVSSAAPSASTPGVVAGDTWWRVDGDGTIFGQWTWTGTAWVPATIRSEVIANLDVGKLVVTGDARFTQAVVDRLFADVFAAHKITASELSIGAVGPDGELVADSVRGVHIQDGTVSANKIIIDGDPENPDEVGLVARIAAIMQLAVEHLVVTDGATIDAAVILKLASEMVTAGVIRTAETGQRVVIDQGGVVLIGLDDDGFEYELVRLGPSGENLLTIGDTTVAPDGIATPTLETGAVSINGRSILDLIGDGARGVVAYSEETRNSAWDGSALERRRMQVSAVLEPGRRYSVTVATRLFALRTAGSAVRIVERIRVSTTQATDTQTWDQLTSGATILAASTATQNSASLTATFDTGNLTAPTWHFFRWTVLGVSGRDHRIVAGTTSPVTMTLRDEGPSLSATSASWFDTGTAAEGTTDAPPPTTEKTVVTEKFAATRAESWDRGSSSFLSSKSGTVYQGKYPGVNAREGAWWFNSFTGNLSGATIKKVQLRFYVTHTYWGAGGTVDIRLHGKTGFTTGGLDTSIRTLKVKRNAQYSIDVPAQYLDAFRTGTWRGFGLSTASTNLEYYVQARLADAEVWITYEKG